MTIPELRLFTRNNINNGFLSLMRVLSIFLSAMMLFVFPGCTESSPYRQQLLCLRQLNRLPHLSLTKRITHQQQSTRQRELWNQLLHDLGRRQDTDIRRLSDFIQGLKEKQPPTGEKTGIWDKPFMPAAIPCCRETESAEKEYFKSHYAPHRK